MSPAPRLAAEIDPARDRRRGLFVFGLALLPALVAIWWTPWFVTQDGPAHLYNAHIIARSLVGDPTFAPYYQVRWQPFPNWAGHLATAAVLELLPARQANRAMTTLTLVGFAGAIVWLRWRVVGWRGMPGAALLAVILALNVTWLLGFTSFLLGACLFPITLGIWWAGRDSFGPRHAAVLAALVVLGYFSHLISLGLTVAGVAFLAVFAPGPRRGRRVAWTAAGLLPLLPLAKKYRDLSDQGGPFEPIWENMTDPFSLQSWLRQMGWVDPISLARKMVFPFVERADPWYALLSPVIWLGIALVLAGVATVRSGRIGERWVWGVLAALLVLGGLVSPDTFGASHGNYMPQRIVLLGLVAVVPFLDLEARGWVGQAAFRALVIAVAVQSAFVWEYAAVSDRTAGAVMRDRDAVGKGHRVATLLIHSRSRFRANPLRHADNLLGIRTGNIVWNNYETLHYYFPVQFRREVARPDAAKLEWISVHDDPGNRLEREPTWQALLAKHHETIDRLVVWDDDPVADAEDWEVFNRYNRRWFVTVRERGSLRILRRK